MPMDTGQNDHSVESTLWHNQMSMQQRAKSIQNSSRYGIKPFNTTTTTTTTTTQLYKLSSLQPKSSNQMNENNDNVNPRKLTMTIRIEFDNNKEINKTDVSPTLLIHVMELLQGWKNCNSIEGIYDHSRAIQIEDFQDTDRWLDQPKVTVKKNNIYAELYIQLHTQYTTYQLYQHQKQLCDSK